MSRGKFTQIWSKEDYRQAVADFRAQVVEIRAGQAAERDELAAVIDITTRERIA